MSAQREIRMTPAVWAAVLAKYVELRRPLTDAELRVILGAGSG